MCLFLLALLVSFIPSASYAWTLEGKVAKVADGDTITVLDINQEQHRVRIARIDAPEKGQPFSNASRKKLRELVAGKEVKVEFEKFGRYGRIVWKVWAIPFDCLGCGKTLDVGLMQVTTGMAWWYRKNDNEQSAEDQGRYESAEEEAKAQKIGLWQEKNPVPPWEYRRMSR